MSEEVEKSLDVLTGTSNNEPSDDWKKKYEELERKYNGVRVEEGRIKKLNEELDARDKRIAELEADHRKSDIMSVLSDDDRANIPDEVLNVATKMVNKGMMDMKAENDRRFKELEARQKAETEQGQEASKQAFVNRLDSEFPGFLSSVGPGGDKAQAWASYQRYNAASIREAINSCDFDTLKYHVEQFFTIHLGVPVPSGRQDGSAAPEPRTTGGGATRMNAAQGKVYTIDEYNELFDKKEIARDRGDYAEVKRLSDEINRAQAEGRIK